MNLKEVFDKHNAEFLNFDAVEKKLSNRADLHAFLLLEKLVPGYRDMVCAAEHDQIYLDTDVEKLVEVASESQIIELIRCGVMLDSETEGLTMFV